MRTAHEIGCRIWDPTPGDCSCSAQYDLDQPGLQRTLAERSRALQPPILEPGKLASGFGEGPIPAWAIILSPAEREFLVKILGFVGECPGLEIEAMRQDLMRRLSVGQNRLHETCG